MGDIGASVLARLKNKAKETGRSNALYLQLFCQEEFNGSLARRKHEMGSDITPKDEVVSLTTSPFLCPYVDLFCQ